MRYWDIVSRATEIMEESNPDVFGRLERLHKSMRDMIKEMHEIDDQASKLKMNISMGDVMEPVYSSQDALAKLINKAVKSVGR